MSSTAPVRIAGAGPAGLVAAITLARAGREVELFERRTVCGARFGGDLQGLENWSSDEDVLDEFRAAGLAIDFHAAPFSGGIQSDGARDDRFAFSRPAFYLVKRGDVDGSLDRALARQAAAAGVHIRYATACPPGTADIDASGPRGRAPFAIDAGIVFETDAPDQAIALLNTRAAPRGYAYLLVTEGYGCCCTMLYEHFPSIHARLAHAHELLLARRGITVRDPRPVGGLGHVRARGTWTSGDARCVGEAAGLQDFLWGFGIRLAVQSGVLAARAILEGRDYASAAAARFAPVLRRGVVNRWLWELGRGADFFPVRAALRTIGPERVLRALHRDAWWSDAIAPLAHRALASRYPGVFADPGPKALWKATAPLAPTA
mgnify:CR=1 FL=1